MTGPVPETPAQRAAAEDESGEPRLAETLDRLVEEGRPQTTQRGPGDCGVTEPALRSVLIVAGRRPTGIGRSDGADGLGLRALGALGDLELHTLVLVETAVAV